MPILTNLSRRFHMFTSDATPHPPRIRYTNNLNEDKTNEKSNTTSKTNKSQINDPLSTNSPRPETTEKDKAKFPTCDSKQHQKSGTKTNTKTKSKQYSQSARVVNYNIINSNGVKIGSRTSYICNVNQFPMKNTASSENFKPKSQELQMPTNVKHLCDCTDEITLEDIFIIKTHIGHGWRDVTRRLLYSDGQIEQFEENYKFKGISEVIYQVFLDWKRANTNAAEIGHLISALWACQEYDCAKRLASAREHSI